MTTPPRKPIDLWQLVIFLAGFILAGFGSWSMFDGRVTKVETTMENAHLSEVPQRLATIETLLRQRDGDGPR